MNNKFKSAFKMEYKDLNHHSIPNYQLAWLASVIECEGSITFGCHIRGKNKDMLSISPFIGITNSDKLLIEEAKRLMDILSERSFGSKPRYCNKYNHGVRPGYKNNQGYKTNLDCKNLRLDGQATKLVLLPCLAYFRSSKKANAAIVLDFLKFRKENLFLRDKLGRIIRKGYSKDEIKKICLIRSHPKGLTYEDMIKCNNVVN